MKQQYLGIFFILAGLHPTLVGQSLQWERYHKTNIYSEGYYVSQTPDGGYFAVGENGGFGGSGSDRMYIVKTDAEGYLEWELSLGPGGSEGHSGLVTSDGNLLAVGEYRPASGGSAAASHSLIKVSMTGNIIWQQEYTALPGGSDESYSVVETNDGHFIAGGRSGILKTDTSGNAIWQKDIGEGNSKDIVLGYDGNYIFTNFSTYENGVIKTDTSGSILWEYTQPSSIIKFYSLTQTADSGILVGGLETNLDAYYLAKLDKNGILEWDTMYEIGNAQALGFFTYGKPFTINQTSDGNFIMCGSIEFPGASANHCWLQKIDENGSVLWKNTHLLSGWNFYYHVEETADKGFVICGEGYTSGNNVIILKTDSTGAFCTNEVLASPSKICIGDTATVISLATDPNFIWKINGQVDSSITSKIIETDTFSRDIVFEVLSNSCATTKQTTLNVHRYFNTISTSGIGPYICQGGNVALTSYDALSYLWSTGDTSQTISVNSAGSYSVTATNLCGTYDTSYQTVITPNPAALPPPDTSICKGDSIQLAASGGNAYFWTPGQYVLGVNSASALFFPPSSTTIYNIVSDTTTACSTWVSVQINVDRPIIPFVLVNGDLTGCKGSTATLSTNTNNLPYYQFDWSNGDSLPQTQTFESGPYYLDFTNLCGTFRTDTITADYTEFPMVSIADDTVAACASEHLQLSVSGDASTYFWYELNRQPDTVWSEGFNYPNSTFQGPGNPAKWTTSCSCFLQPGDYFSVFNGQIEGTDLDGVGSWTSEWIDISSYPEVDITLDIEETGTMESNDFVYTTYEVFGQQAAFFETNGVLTDDFTSATVIQEGLSGDSVRIKVRISNFSAGEYHRFDNVVVVAYDSILQGSSIQLPIGNASSMVVYADTAGCISYDTVIVTEDGLICSPAIFSDNLTTSSARLNWIPSDSCNYRYQIRGRNVNFQNWITLEIVPGSPNNFDVFNLPANSTYVWQIRAYCSATDPNDVTDWSELDTFTTKCFAPDSIWIDTVTSSSARLRWTAVTGAFGYEIRGGVIGSSAIVRLTIPGQITTFDVFNLAGATSYNWQVRAFCSANGTAASLYSDIDTFTTPLNKRNNTFGIEADVKQSYAKLYPNPLSEKANLVIYNAGQNERSELTLSDLNGKVVLREAVAGRNIIQINGSQLHPGIYLYQITGPVDIKGKLVVSGR